MAIRSISGKIAANQKAPGLKVMSYEFLTLNS